MRLRAKFVHVIAAALMPLIALGQNPLPEKAAPTTSKQVAGRIIEDGGTGPYKAIMASDGSLPTHTIFRPKDLRPFGDKLKLPIVAWGNGACANSPWEHVNFLSEIASHGYLVVAIGPMPEEGQRGGPGGPTKSPLLTDAINWAIAQNGDEASQFYQKLDTNEIGVAGMSCGGLQALEVAPDSRVSTVIICNSGLFTNPTTARPGMPNLGKEQLAKLHTPVLYILGGEKDIAYRNGMDDVQRINHVPIFAANLNVGHGGTYSKPHGGEFAKVAVGGCNGSSEKTKGRAKCFSAIRAGWRPKMGGRSKRKTFPELSLIGDV